ncbi:MAG: hypothetical protein ABFD58_02745, partial [Anaerolineaceae bacterium]
FNDWVDANAFFTMGKGMMHGLVPYRDLFEQKGPLLYFVYGLASLVSYRTFIGGFILEVIAFTFFLFFSFKSLSLFMDKKLALISLPILSILILNLKAFTHGGSAEELCLSLLAVSLYHLLRYLKSDKPAADTFQIFFWNGLIAGCILWVKFSMLGFWLGWFLAFSIGLIAQKQVGQAFRGIGTFLGGIAAATIPWVIYFWVNHAIPDWINTYFVINLTSYSETQTLLDRVINILIFLTAQFIKNPVFGTLLWFGIIGFAVFSKFLGMLYKRILMLVCLFLLIVGVYWGGTGYIYYYLFLTPFVLFGLIVIADALKGLILPVISHRAMMVVGIILIISLPLEYKFDQNAYMLRIKRQDLVQYKFAKIIDRSPDKSLLNYGSLDMGFYTTAGVLPGVKYFEVQNLQYSRYPLNIDEQNRYLREGVTEFVVLRDFNQKNIPNLEISALKSKYSLVASGDQYFEGYMFTYYLFQRVD